MGDDVAAELRDLRRELAAVERRTRELELTVVKRNGPLVAELHAATAGIAAAASREELRTELARQTSQIARQRAGERGQRFSRGEKLAAILFAAIVAGIDVLHVFGVG